MKFDFDTLLRRRVEQAEQRDRKAHPPPVARPVSHLHDPQKPGAWRALLAKARAARRDDVMLVLTEIVRSPPWRDREPMPMPVEPEAATAEPERPDAKNTLAERADAARRRADAAPHGHERLSDVGVAARISDEGGLTGKWWRN